ncbi:Hypothetical Protein SiL_0423 [Sulfolobus islandicus LAL14/1]|uniref:Uncharacterized protein n=1 Tax=Saccharolobus islandicus LAL14/1 TaxID=1241935 RepID=M9UBI5_SACIS|nr:Hypothetical Protein SiL_0423 [Sulfolobus islandicus LAL14/1]
MYTHPYSGFKPNFRSELEVKLTDWLYAQGSQRPEPQSDMCNTDLTNMFYIRKSDNCQNRRKVSNTTVSRNYRKLIKMEFIEKRNDEYRISDSIIRYALLEEGI